VGVGAEDGDSVAPAPGWSPPQAARRAPASDHNTPPMAATEAIDVSYVCQVCGKVANDGLHRPHADTHRAERGEMVILCRACLDKIAAIFDDTKRGRIRVSRALSDAVIGLGGTVWQQSGQHWYEYNGTTVTRWSSYPYRVDPGCPAHNGGMHWDGEWAAGPLFALGGSAADAAAWGR